MPRLIHEIANEVYDEIRRGRWAQPCAALPYLEAMLSLNLVTDNYGHDSARSVLRYFLSNAATFRGETARRIKAEIKELLK